MGMLPPPPICPGIWSCGSTGFGGGEKFENDMFMPSGKSWSGWKFSQSDCEMLGELRVTRKRSGGVAGTENVGLNGDVGRVFPRELPVPRYGSCCDRWLFGDICGPDMDGPLPDGCPISLDGVTAGVCGLDLS